MEVMAVFYTRVMKIMNFQLLKGNDGKYYVKMSKKGKIKSLSERNKTAGTR